MVLHANVQKKNQIRLCSRKAIFFFCSQILGRYTYVLNCTPNMTLECMEKVLKGSLKVGNLLCFHNMQNLSQEMISVVGDMLQNVHDGLHAKKKVRILALEADLRGGENIYGEESNTPKCRMF